MGASDIPIGERVRFYRTAKRKRQAVVAGLAGITVEYLSQIERGLKTPAVPVLFRLASCLDVPVAALLGEPVFESQPPGHAVTPAIERALATSGSAAVQADGPDLVQLRERVDSTWSIWETSPARYTETGPLLPDLIRAASAAPAQFRGQAEAENRRRSFQVAADLYFLLRAFCRQIDRQDLSLLSADRALRAAQDADDPRRLAAARWELAHALLAGGEAEGAEEVSRRAREELGPRVAAGEADFVALDGSLRLVGAMARLRAGDPGTSRRTLVAEARPAADLLGEHPLWGMWFGPTNVGLHAVTLEMEAGEIAEAVRLAEKVDVSRSASVERRARFYLDLARCYDQRRSDFAVLAYLQLAERQSPEEVRYKPLARDLVRSLLRRARPSYAGEIRALAERVGVYG
jgi:transcriptional regulator with XRE-family HTH domain